MFKLEMHLVAAMSHKYVRDIVYVLNNESVWDKLCKHATTTMRIRRPPSRVGTQDTNTTSPVSLRNPDESFVYTPSENKL